MRICNAFRKAAQCASDARCVAIRGVSPRSSQPTRTRPPPSAALRCAATSPLRGGGLLLPWQGVLGSRGSASHKHRGSRRRPKTRQPEAPQTRNSNSSPFGGRWRAQRDRRGALRICSAFRFETYLQRVSIRGVSPRSSQLTRTRPPPTAALRCAATSPLRGGGLLLPWRGELGPRSGAKRIQYPLDSAKTRANK